MIELMMVIAIIAILMSILIPAVNAVLNRAHMAAAKSEMSQIGTAISTFKAKFGKIPPSYISFKPMASGGALPPATRAILRSMFPQINMTNGKLAIDLANAGLAGKVLYGPEALVFFLGGVRKKTASGFSKELIGFSKNPARPFYQPTVGSTTGLSNRIGPFFQFDAARLGEIQRDATNGQITVKRNATTGTPLAYLGSLEGQTGPLLYVSTARTNSYAPTDAPALNTKFSWKPYSKSTGTYYNPTSYQLISPGYDGEYGNGGVYDKESTSGVGTKEQDNFTNFSDGTLGG